MSTFEIPDDLPECPQCGRAIRAASRVGLSAHLRPCDHIVPEDVLKPSHVDEIDDGERAIADGGVVAYDCPECGEITECNVDDVGQRRCPDCDRAVTAIVTDGGREPVASTGGGRHAPMMGGTTCETDSHSHFCDEVGSTVYAPRRRCPYRCYENLESDGGRDVDEDDETVVMNPDVERVPEIASHHDHEGYSVFRVGAGELVDIHISCDECSIRYIIEDVPKDQAENPGKYIDDGGDSA